MRFQRIDVVRDGLYRRLVVFDGRQFQQFVRITEPGHDAVDAFHEFGQPRAFAAEILRALRLIPDLRVFEFAGYFFEAFTLDRVVKDTP
jgi:hypothetical protein